MTNTPILITGASGNLGQRVLELLLEQKAGPLIATTRAPQKLSAFAAKGVEVRAANFDDLASLQAAFKGAGRALLISTDALDRPGHRLEQQQRAVAALESSGVGHAVYTSCPNPEQTLAAVGPDHAGTEAALAKSKLDYTVLRNALYTDLLLGVLPGAVASGKLLDARGSGRTNYVTRDDCARAAAAALVAATPGRQVVDVTGPAALSSDEIAALVTTLVGKPVAHLSVPPAALIEGMVAHGLPKPIAEMYASFDLAIAKGEYERVSDGFQQLTGRAPQSVSAFLAEHKSALLKA